MFIGYRLKIFVKIFIKISSISDAIQNKTLPKSEELERILFRIFFKDYSFLVIELFLAKQHLIKDFLQDF